MNPNPLLGVFFHWLGGLASGSFYVAYRGVKNWAWETYWLVGGFFSWIIAPWLLASTMTCDLSQGLHQAPWIAVFWAYFFGVLWGLGGLTFGLTMRYLGLSLGMAVALGLTTVIGTIGPPLFHGLIGELAATPSGRITFIGIGITLIGIVLVAMAGRAKEREGAGGNGSSANDSSSIAEVDLRKRLFIAIFSGCLLGWFVWRLYVGQP